MNDKIDIDFLSNVFYTLESIDSLKKHVHKIYLSTVNHEGNYYNIGSSFVVAPDITVVDFVKFFLKALDRLEDCAYPIDRF